MSNAITTQTEIVVHPVTPHLVCDPAADALEYYKKVFGATEVIRYPDPSGKLIHAMININGSSVFLVDEFKEYGSISPKSLGGSPVTIHLTVPDVDAVVARAVESGATVTMAVEDMPWGDRYGIIVDPFGHNWSIATPRPGAPRTVEEFEAAMKAAGM